MRQRKNTRAFQVELKGQKLLSSYILQKKNFFLNTLNLLFLMDRLSIWSRFLPHYHLEGLVIAITYSSLLPPRGKFKNELTAPVTKFVPSLFHPSHIACAHIKTKV